MASTWRLANHLASNCRATFDRTGHGEGSPNIASSNNWNIIQTSTAAASRASWRASSACEQPGHCWALEVTSCAVISWPHTPTWALLDGTGWDFSGWDFSQSDNPRVAYTDGPSRSKPTPYRYGEQDEGRHRRCEPALPDSSGLIKISCLFRIRNFTWNQGRAGAGRALHTTHQSGPP